MRINATKKIILEDFGADDRTFVQKLAQILNPFLDQTSQALTNQLSLKDNLKGQEWLAQSLPAGTTSLKLAWTVNEQPKHVYCGRLYKKDDSAPSAVWSMNWSYANGQVTVSFLGLDSSTDYKFNLVGLV